ncbi:hypothetical protein MtrunA17_Chr7g0245361 [Medicago truncatula]|uniref:Uncharacterized protein n=1 Tax=Medicago truncatula TaxID=3880 RepID=G7KY94_MEDTR|nr:uncharacterized protein LOC11423452 [Medicago truncatula]AES79882.1 hypothetical protein MTR_7g074220 [Medicago truncatula]RHN46731.1 hypothetical protein MtrunA17_Chr7g0245361 [Medicago truncatula]
MEESMKEILDCSDEEDPYIEIELDTAVTTTIHKDENNNNCIDDDIELEQEEEYKLRISISSTISVSLQKESIISVDGASEIGATKAPMSPQPQQQQHSGVSHNDGVEFPWKTPQTCGPTTVLGTNSTRVIPYDNVDVLYAPRKQPSLTTTTTANGIMMKLLIKFRGIKIKSLFASLIKPRQTNYSSKKSITFFRCYQKELVNPSNGRNSKNWNFGEDDSMSASLRKSKKLMEMDLGALRGVFSRSKRRKTASTSCDNSPIHDGFSKDNSIQAAIAYCKSSFGQTDFTFTSSITSTPSRFVDVAYPN